VKRILFILLLALISCFSGLAQDSEYIENRSHQFQLHLYGKKKFTDISFSDPLTKTDLVYSPNDQVKWGLGFNWRFVGLGFAFVKFNKLDDKIYGDTRGMDWQVQLYGKRSVVDVVFYYYSSYYLENPEDVLTNWKEGDANYIRPDIIAASVGLSYIYVLNNKRFSYKAAFVNNAIQKKSAGSFIFGGQFNFSDKVADSSFFPTNSNFGSYDPLVRMNRNSFGLNLGYAYTFVYLKNFYTSLSMSVLPGFGVNNIDIKHRINHPKPALGISALPRFSTGFNADIYYGGFSFISVLSSLDASNKNLPELSWMNGSYRVFLGRRF
jgi:hypothetical protein